LTGNGLKGITANVKC